MSFLRKNQKVTQSELVSIRVPRVEKFTLFLCGMMMSPIGAKNYDNLESLSLEELLNIEITVASNFSETELEVGSTVEIIHNSQWRDFGATNVSEAISHQPGVMVYPVPWGGTSIAIRGYSSIPSVRGIATLLDGIPLNNFRAGTALYDIRSFALSSLSKIEMIRGPGSALYGSDAFHGVLSMQTYESDTNNSNWFVDISTAGFKTTNLNHTSILNEELNIHASVSGVNQSSQDIPFSYTVPGTTTVLESSRSNAYEAYTGILKFDYSFSDEVSSKIGIYIKGHDSKESVSAGQSTSPFGSILLDKDITDGNEDMQAMKAELEIKLKNNILFVGHSYYWTQDYNAYSDTTPLPGVGLYTIALGSERHWGVNLLFKQPENTWNTQWAVGIDYKSGEVIDNRTQFSLSNENRTPVAEQINPQTGFERDVKGVVLSAKTKLLESHLQLIYGGRIDNYTDFGSRTTPRYGLIYLLSESSAIKYLYGEAFRAPTTSELYSFNTLKGSFDLKPEIIETSELVYIYQQENWKVNFTLFKSDWTNGIILVPTTDPNFTAEYQNVGRNKADGFEMSWRGVIDNWRWDISASQVSSQSISADGNNDYSSFPERIFNLNFGYKHSNLDVFVTHRIHQSVTEGPITNNVPSPKSLDDFHMTNVTIEWNITNQWNAQLGVKNVFDRDNFLPGIWSNENGIMTLGRFFQAGFNWRFD